MAPAAALVVLLTLGACGGASGAAARPAEAAVAEDDRIRVVATFSILADLVMNVGQELIDLRVLVGRGSDTHTFRPSPTAGVALEEADLVFESGLGFEAGWFDALFTATASRAVRVAVTDGITPLRVRGDDGAPPPTASPPAVQVEGEPDPHVWHDVTLAIHMTRRIRDALAQTDPGNAAAYRANAETFVRELEALHRWVEDRVASLAPERRTLVTSHEVFGYFAARYGFELVGSTLGTASTEATDPSAADVARLIQAIKRSGARAFFTEATSSARLSKRIADAAGVRDATLYTDALTPPGGPADSYVGLIRANVTTIVRGLRD
jgi:ABC-type Zn uptake system ZnuABC Zn-binding protein ZnuA